MKQQQMHKTKAVTRRGYGDGDEPADQSVFPTAPPARSSAVSRDAQDFLNRTASLVPNSGR